MAKREIIAVDLGGTNLRAALVKNNKIIKYIKKKTPKSESQLIKELCNSIEILMSNRVKGIGIGSAGPLKGGIIKNPPNIPLRNLNLRQLLKKKFKKRVEVENDANCVALAEARFGCRKKNFFILTLGTGVGGGVIIEKRLFKGSGYGGELGHIILDNGKDFEELWKSHRKLSKRYFGKTLLVKDLIKTNNKKCREILDNTSKYIGQAIGSLINIFDPEVVILSGGIKETGDVFLSMIKKHTEKYIILPKKTPIQWTKLKHPGILGASLLID